MSDDPQDTAKELQRKIAEAKQKLPPEKSGPVNLSQRVILEAAGGSMNDIKKPIEKTPPRTRSGGIVSVQSLRMKQSP